MECSKGLWGLWMGDLGNSRSVSRRVGSIFFFLCNFCMGKFILYCRFVSFTFFFGVLSCSIK